MSHDDLLRALEVVHRELNDSEHLDADEVSRLRETMREIQDAIDPEKSENDESVSLTDRISESTHYFEEHHPRLTNTLGRIADMLQQMGF